MSHPLDGARLKVVRAKEHLKSFNEDAWRYVSTDPYDVVFKTEGDDISVEGVITAEPPPALACIVGDFVTNLRASLDYIAWELVMLAMRTSGRQLSEREERAVSWPIIPNPAGFTNANRTVNHLQTVCGVPASSMSIIERFQPYQAGYEVLSALDLLVRTDKHRTLLLCALFMRSAGKVSIYRGNKLAWTVEGMTGMKMNLAAFGPSFLPTTDYSMKVEEKPTVLVALKDFPVPATFVGILEDILKCVDGIIPKFDQLFV